MHRKLLEKAFEKAKLELDSDRPTHLARHLSDFIFEDSEEQYGERILRDYLNKIKKNTEEKITIKAFAAESLSHYLEYESFSEFLRDNPSKTLNKSTLKKNVFKEHKVTLITAFVIIVGFLIYNAATKQRWMVWQEDHYVEVDFDIEKYKLNQLKVYNQDRIDNFKKVTPDDSYEFFNDDGSVNLWYGKNTDKEYEFFTDFGKHPETGKSLKDITKYMIQTHILNKKNDLE